MMSMKTCHDILNPLETAVCKALAQVVDPEIGESIVNLGLVYGIEAGENTVRVELTMTSPACPMGAMIVDDAMEALSKTLPDGTQIDIALVWEPPWNPGMMSAEAKDRLGWH